MSEFLIRLSASTTLLVARFYPAQIISVLLVDIGGLIVALIVALAILYKIGWWQKRAVPKWLAKDISSLGLSKRLKILSRVVTKDALAVEPLFHHYKKRWALHFLVFYGFVGLMITTTLDAIVNRPGNPLPILSPVKIIGNVSGVLLLAGATPMLFTRKKNDKNAVPLTLADRAFLPLLYLVTLTGFIVEIFDYGGIPYNATIFYIIHIALLTGLLVSAPWTRFINALQAPYLALYERLREGAEKRRGDRVDYKRLDLAEFVKSNFYPDYLKREEKKEDKEKKQK
ncbi:MAG: hypothetical protein ACYC9U_03770 [Nitrososphaerales archaeon]